MECIVGPMLGLFQDQLKTSFLILNKLLSGKKERKSIFLSIKNYVVVIVPRHHAR